MTRADRDACLATLMAQVDAIMQAHGISQAELARRMQCHPAVVSNVLKLKVDPRMSTLLAVLRALDCSLEIRSPVVDVVE